MNRISSDKIAVYDWHSIKGPFIYLLGLGCFVCAIGAACILLTDAPKIFSLGLATAFTLGGFGCLSRSKTLVNYTRQTLIRETLFLDKVLIWRKSYRFEDFNSVVVDQRIGGDRSNCFVGLVLSSGRKILITYFENSANGFTSSSAENFATQLSCDFKLPIKKVG
jgi:hypothetical protein